MKQSISFIFTLGLMALAFFSCDDDAVSKKHVYTEEEIRWKDSLEAVRNNIKADYIFTYTVDLPLDSIAYRGVEVPVDTDVLIEKLGFSTVADLTAAMGTVTGGVQFDHTIPFFAINNSTRYDYTEKLTAQGFGHWFDKNGDVGVWGETAAVFSELDAEAFVFFVGQYPKHLKKGDKHKIIQVLGTEDYRVAFVFNITVGDYYTPPKATNVATVDLTLEITPNNEYVPTDLDFDFAEAAAKIGVSEEELSDNLTFFGINTDKSMTSSYTADAGYWYTEDGDVTNWGEEGCAVFVNYEDGTFHIGQFPEFCQPGDEYTVSVAIMYKTTKMVTYNITVQVK